MLQRSEIDVRKEKQAKTREKTRAEASLTEKKDSSK